MSRQNFCNRQSGHGYNEGLHIPYGELQRRMRSPYFTQPPESIPTDESRVIAVGRQEDKSFHIFPVRNRRGEGQCND